MEEPEPRMMVVCGLDFGTCDIRLLPADPDAVCIKLEAFATDGQAPHKEAVERLKQIAKSRR